MPVVRSFPPIARRDALVLVLGTMPSPASLAARQFYGHRQNAFWRIMGHLFDAGLDRPYAQRTRRLKEHRLAVWDVLQQCDRAGSLDSNIVLDSEVPNDFETFFKKHRQVRAIFFNGTKAHSSFIRHVLQPHGPLSVEGALEGVVMERLPSTSPAHAMMNLDEKLRRWRQILQFLTTPGT